ncbi:hypothetical protein WS70_19685 [Burkholderia mayonis]|uniref:Uncharacterized protein n=1 Tax=Burkholderia mayonis TaxID=1385591 RepID=A0A1B4FKB6_9BURK|nr:hypothetical protein WS70_19685 [Burkholderia mayonis]KVE45602.1 hypothetical protein WS69_04050 [Burkholderia sp. BDU5]KVE46122.1 hypothetical protein WS70_03015 [Burkholderia mayonis]
MSTSAIAHARDIRAILASWEGGAFTQSRHAHRLARWSRPSCHVMASAIWRRCIASDAAIRIQHVFRSTLALRRSVARDPA